MTENLKKELKKIRAKVILQMPLTKRENAVLVLYGGGNENI